MATQEFYIRNATETEARGPFTNEHLISLAETGQITRDTLYYDAAKEEWIALSANSEIMAVAFPEKIALKLKAKTKLKTLNVADVSAAAISVDDMLAAAEGRTEDTKDKLDPAIARARAASIGLYTTIVLLLISAIGLIMPSIDILNGDLTLTVLLQHPLLILGGFNCLLAFLLILQVTQAYQCVRFSAMMGLGLTGFLLWVQGQPVPLAAFAVGSVGLYFCTVMISFAGIGLAAGLGLTGMIGYTFFALTT